MMAETQTLDTRRIVTGSEEEKALAAPSFERGLALMSPGDVLKQLGNIQLLMREAMVPSVDFGLIPGCGDKPSLFKAGAEKLGVMFRIYPRFTVDRRELENGHREYDFTCRLYVCGTDELVTEGVGTCSTLESRYRWRYARTCPECGVLGALRRSRNAPVWYCWAKIGGCGCEFKSDDQRIVNQPARIENPDIADVYNTVKKIGKKRAHVDAILIATGASALFAVDLEDEAIDDAESAAQGVGAGSQPEAKPSSDRAEKLTRRVKGGKGGKKAAPPTPEQEAEAQDAMGQPGPKAGPIEIDPAAVIEERYGKLVSYVSQKASVSMDDGEKLLIAWMKPAGWTKAALADDQMAHLIWARAQRTAWERAS